MEGQILWRQETGELGPCLIQVGRDTVGVGRLCSRVRLGSLKPGSVIQQLCDLEELIYLSESQFAYL